MIWDKQSQYWMMKLKKIKKNIIQPKLTCQTHDTSNEMEITLYKAKNKIIIIKKYIYIYDT